MSKKKTEYDQERDECFEKSQKNFASMKETYLKFIAGDQSISSSYAVLPTLWIRPDGSILDLDEAASQIRKHFKL